MKRFIGVFLCMAVFLSMVPISVHAWTSESEYSEYVYSEYNRNYYKREKTEYAGDTEIESIKIEADVEELYDGMFEGCSNLCEIENEATLKRIGKNAFKATAYYSDLSNWEEGVLYIGNCLIKADPKQMGEEYTVKDDTRLIADGAFEGCETLKKITIPDTVEFIGKDAFSGTAFYKDSGNWKDGYLYFGEYLLGVRPEEISDNVIVSPGTTCIADHAFEDCDKVVTVDLPDSLKYVGNRAFRDCDKLKNVSFGRYFKKIGLEAFDECASVSKFSVPPVNEHFSVVSGILYSKDQSVLYKCPVDYEGAVVMSEYVTTICSYAFRNCKKIDSVIVPEQCEFIGKYAFAGCSSLANLILPVETQIIGEYSFSDCDAIEKVAAVGKLSYIGKYAFEGCDNLKEVDLDCFVLKLDEGVFKDCVSLSKIDIWGLSEITETAFEGSGVFNALEEWEGGLSVFSGKYLMKVAPGTVGCKIPEGITAIANGAFDDTVDTLKYVHVPSSIDGFRFGAFGVLGNDVKVFYDRTLENFGNNTDFDRDAIDLYTRDQAVDLLIFIIFIVVIVAVLAIIKSKDDRAILKALRERRRKAFVSYKKKVDLVTEMVADDISKENGFSDESQENKDTVTDKADDDMQKGGLKNETK